MLIIGCGDVGLRVAKALPSRVAQQALTSSVERLPELRQRGLRPLLGNLDQPQSLRRLAGAASRILYLAPPPGEGSSDPRLKNLLRALRGRSLPRALVYASTSGVYGDCQGAVIDETRVLQPTTPRAQRRVDAETGLRWWGRSSGVCSSILRIPGIYAPDRIGGDPRARVRKGVPVLHAAEDVYTNHIHADDLARICIAALWRGAAQRVYHAVDDTDMLTGDYLDAVAQASGLPRPPRISRAQAVQTLTPERMSFLNESRRLSNRRMKTELRVRLQFPTVLDGLRAA